MWNYLFKPIQASQETGESIYRDGSDSLHEGVTFSSLKVPTPYPKVLLIDDEASFGKIMQRTAQHLSLELTYCRTLDDLPNLVDHDYDIAIVDYDLGAVTGVEIADYIESFSRKEVPIILVSQTQRKLGENSPESIREFVHKELGPIAIFDAVFEAYEVNKLHKAMRTKM